MAVLHCKKCRLIANICNLLQSPLSLTHKGRGDFRKPTQKKQIGDAKAPSKKEPPFLERAPLPLWEGLGEGEFVGLHDEPLTQHTKTLKALPRPLFQKWQTSMSKNEDDTNQSPTSLINEQQDLAKVDPAENEGSARYGVSGKIARKGMGNVAMLRVYHDDLTPSFQSRERSLSAATDPEERGHTQAGYFSK
jgi:hypothetical protein